MGRALLPRACGLLVILSLLQSQLECYGARVPALEENQESFLASPAAERFFWPDDAEDKNCVTGWKCPDETPYCLKSKKLKLKGVCVECIETDMCNGNLLCSGASQQCLLPPLMLFSIKYEGIFPADFTDALMARVCSNVLSLVPGLKGTCEIQGILPGSAIVLGYIIGQQSASGDSYEEVLQGVQQLAGTMNGPLNSNLENALLQGFPSGTTVSEVKAKVLTDYDPNNIQPLPVPPKGTIVFTNEETGPKRCLLNSTGAFVDCINAGLDGYRVDNIAVDPNQQWVTFAGVPSDSEYFSTNATYTCPLNETGIVQAEECRVTSSSGAEEFYQATLYDSFARRVWFYVLGNEENVLARQFTNAGPFRMPSQLENALAQEDRFAAAADFGFYGFFKTCEIESNGDYNKCQISGNETECDWFPFLITGGPDARGFYVLNVTSFTENFTLSYCPNSLTLPCPVVTGIPYEEMDTAAVYDILFPSSNVAYLAAGNTTGFFEAQALPLQRCSIKSPREFTDCSAVESPFTDEFVDLARSANAGSNMYVAVSNNSTTLSVCDVDPAGSLVNCKVGYSDLFGTAFSEPVVF